MACLCRKLIYDGWLDSVAKADTTNSTYDVSAVTSKSKRSQSRNRNTDEVEETHDVKETIEMLATNTTD